MSMWANMLGLGPLLGQLQDPAFLAHVQRILASIEATAARCERIENKINYLIAVQHERNNGDDAAISSGMGADAARGATVTGGAHDDGALRDPRSVDRVGSGGNGTGNKAGAGAGAGAAGAGGAGAGAGAGTP
jgi:hypothetical protein